LLFDSRPELEYCDNRLVEFTVELFLFFKTESSYALYELSYVSSIKFADELCLL